MPCLYFWNPPLSMKRMAYQLQICYLWLDFKSFPNAVLVPAIYVTWLLSCSLLLYFRPIMSHILISLSVSQDLYFLFFFLSSWCPVPLELCPTYSLPPGFSGGLCLLRHSMIWLQYSMVVNYATTSFLFYFVQKRITNTDQLTVNQLLWI